MTNSAVGQERSRLRVEYTSRDKSGINKQYVLTNPTFLYHLHEREREILSILTRHNVILSDLKVLEVGCGTGHILQRFLEFGVQQVAGIDLIEPRLRLAKTMYPNVVTLMGNGAELPFRDETFDMVMQFMCLSSVLDDNVRRLIADEMWRVVKPGGVILTYDMRPIPKITTFWLKSIRLLSLLRRYWRNPDKREHHITSTRPLGLKELRDLFGSEEFECRSLSLQFDLAQIAKTTPLFLMLLSKVPGLRSHYLALSRKR
jgi:ubiquinone/menaquinone biosynthesis C-methylase UbiE